MKEKITEAVVRVLTEAASPLTAREIAGSIGNTSSGSVAIGCGWLRAHCLIEVQYNRNRAATYTAPVAKAEEARAPR